MTKETKIGLVVGLAFIILFAIILSEKGTESRDSAPPSFAVEDGANDAPLLPPEEQPLENVGRLPVRDRLAEVPTLTPVGTDGSREATTIASNINPAHRSSPLGQPIPREDEELPQLPPSFVELLNQSLPQDAADDRPVASAHRDDATIALEDAVAGAIAPLDTEPVHRPADTRREPPAPIETRSLQTDAHQLAQANQAAREADIAAHQRTTNNAATPAPQAPVAILAKHVVKPGESLGKIAARYYGRSTPQRVEAIFLANRDVLSDINKVKANDKLRIPRLDGSTPSSFEPAPNFVGDQLARSRQPIQRPEEVRIPLPVGNQRNSRGTQRNETSNRSDLTPIEPQPTRTAERARPQQPSFTWYEVKDRDTLSRIAKRMLGSGTRYLEIYKLNRDRLPNMNALKVGQKIRIPVRSPRAENSGDEVRSASAYGDDSI